LPTPLQHAPERRDQTGVISGAVVINVVGAERGARQALQHVILSFEVRFEPMKPMLSPPCFF